MSMFNFVHIESGKSITLEHKGFNRNELLQEASNKLETDFDKDKFGQYSIQPK